MKQSVEYRYESIKDWLDKKWASDRGPAIFQELKEKYRVYREATGKRSYGYYCLALVYDVGLEGERHSYENAGKIINRRFIKDPQKWITSRAVHEQKWTALCLLGYPGARHRRTVEEAQRVETSWRQHQKIKEIKGRLPSAIKPVATALPKPEEKWQEGIISNGKKHIKWLEAEKREWLPFAIELKKDLAQCQEFLETIQKLLEIEREQEQLIRKMNVNWKYKYWRNIIKASE